MIHFKVNEYTATFCDFWGNFPKLSTKNTTKQNSSDRYVFCNDTVVGTVLGIPKLRSLLCGRKKNRIKYTIDTTIYIVNVRLYSSQI